MPLAYEPRLLQLRALLADAVSPQQLDRLKTRVSPVRLMDSLYAAQEELIAQTHPDVARELDEFEPPGMFCA